MNVQDLFFETNVHEQEQLQLTVRYRVILDDVTISPATMLVRLSSQQLQQSQNTVLNKILIQDNWDRRLEITDIKSSSGVAVGMYDMVYRCPKGSTVHIFWLTPVLSDSLPIGPFREEIVLTTNHPRFQRVVIPIQGEVTDDRVQVAPTALLFRDTNDRSVRNIRVRAPADAGELVLSGVGSDIEHLRTEIKRIDAQTVDVVVTWPEGVRHSTHVTEGVRKGTIRIGVQGPVTTEKTINVVLLTPAPTTTRAAP
jgi:hypothetical protein